MVMTSAAEFAIVEGIGYVLMDAMGFLGPETGTFDHVVATAAGTLNRAAVEIAQPLYTGAAAAIIWIAAATLPRGKAIGIGILGSWEPSRCTAATTVFSATFPVRVCPGRVPRPRLRVLAASAVRALGQRRLSIADSAQTSRSENRSPLAITFIDSTMMSALKKNAKVVCQITVQRMREVTTWMSEVPKVVAFVNEK